MGGEQQQAGFIASRSDLTLAPTKKGPNGPFSLDSATYSNPAGLHRTEQKTVQTPGSK